MKIESNQLNYLVYKYFFLYASIISLIVFIVLVTGHGKEDEGMIENFIGLTLGLISLMVFMTIRKRFVRVRLDNDFFEILNSNEKGIYSWKEIKRIELVEKYFHGIIFKFKIRSDDNYLYSITDRPKKFPFWNPYKKNIYETEAGSLILAKKRQLKI